MEASTTQSPEHRPAAEVWLRGNLRPVVPLAVVVLVAALVTAAVASWVGGRAPTSRS